MNRFPALAALAVASLVALPLTALAAPSGLLLRGVASGAHPYALLELDRATYLLRVGDRIGGRTIRAIDSHGVRLSDGTQLHVSSAPGAATASGGSGDVTVEARPRAASVSRGRRRNDDGDDQELVAGGRDAGYSGYGEVPRGDRSGAPPAQYPADNAYGAGYGSAGNYGYGSGSFYGTQNYGYGSGYVYGPNSAYGYGSNYGYGPNYGHGPNAGYGYGYGPSDGYGPGAYPSNQNGYGSPNHAHGPGGQPRFPLPSNTGPFALPHTPPYGIPRSPDPGGYR